MVRRLAKYRIDNNSQIAEPSVGDFFRKNNTLVYEEKCETPQDRAVEGFKIYIERVRNFNKMIVYLPN